MGLLRYNKVYVLAPYKYASGGPELSHQLVDYLRTKGRKAFIVYERHRSIVKVDLSVTKEFQNYNIVVSNNIEDVETNVLILPEIYLYLIPSFKKIQICIWWMSVDNAIKYNSNINLIESLRYRKGIYNKIRIFKHLHDIKYSLSRLRKDDNRLVHFYQSVYAQQFLYNLGVSKIVKLSDYINPKIIQNVDTSIEKENIILYNPKKGIKYTHRLMKLMPNYNFVALDGFTHEQLNHLFDRAKIYIDFGNFPGKDRLPREAAIHNCCIITGKFGASRFFEDVPISEEYKFDIQSNCYRRIVAKIKDIFVNYEDRIGDFKFMREMIMKEQKEFFTDINNIFLNSL